MKQPLLITKLQLERAARRAGCCRDYRLRILRARSKDELIDIYVKGLRFCMANDYPRIDYITRHFDKTDYNSRGVYISENLTGKAHHRTLVALGCCNGSLHYTGWNASRLVAKNASRLDIKVDDHAFLMVDLLDDADLTIHASDHARVIVYAYDGQTGRLETDHTGEATITIKHRQKIISDKYHL